VNATLAGGQMAFLHVLRYTANVLFGNHADTMLAGSVEEFTPHSAWAAHLLDNNGRQTPAGEGAAVFVMQRVEESSSAAPACHAHVLATAVGFAPGGEAAGAIPRVLEGCIRSALMQANASASDLITILTTETLGNPSIDSPIPRGVSRGDRCVATGGVNVAAPRRCEPRRQPFVNDRLDARWQRGRRRRQGVEPWRSASQVAP
jgi:3-oxoacyl-[acyl-carrier-protein] synthase II